MDKNNIRSSLSFLNYIVDYVELKNNPMFNETEVEVDFDITTEFDINKEKTNMMVIINVELFKDAEINNYPFEMNLRVFGLFGMNIGDDDIQKYKTNAVAIMYPYIRSLVTTFTANSNMSPLLLPAINVNKLIRKK